jgi:ABC-type bacteriocin/lantibiotic exporter with double-glycine peptidase domain
MLDLKKNDVMSVYYDNSKYTISSILHPFKSAIRRVFCLSFLINILTVLLPLCIMYLIDGKFDLSFNRGGIFNIVFLTSVLGFNFLFRYVRASMINYILLNIDNNVCKNILDKVFKLPAKKIEKKKESFWTTLFADIDVIRNGLSGSYIMNIVDIPFVLLFIGVIGILLGKYFFIVLLFLVVYAVFVIFSSYLLGVVDDKEKLAIKERDELVSTSVHNLSSLKTLSLTDKVMNMWNDYQRSIIDITYKRNYTLDICLVLNYIIFFLGLVIFSLVGMYSFNMHMMSMGAVVAILLLFTLNFYLINNFLKYLPQYFKFINSTERLGQVMAEQVDAFKTEEIEDITIGNLELKDVVLEDSLNNVILKNVSFTFKEGNVYVVRAKNTFDTSLFLKSLIGAYDIDSGEILFDRYNIANLKADSIKNYIHYLGVNYFIIEGTVKENLNCFLNDTDASFAGFVDYKKVAEMFGLDEIISKLPNGYNTIIDSKTDLLTQEEMKLLSIARVFVGNPKVMIFDQPFLGLRKVYKDKLIKAFSEFSSDKIIIVSTIEKDIGKRKVISIENEKISMLTADTFNDALMDINAKIEEEDNSQSRAMFKRIFRKKD